VASIAGAIIHTIWPVGAYCHRSLERCLSCVVEFSAGEQTLRSLTGSAEAFSQADADPLIFMILRIGWMSSENIQGARG
jgi:hypothetical protein